MTTETRLIVKPVAKSETSPLCSLLHGWVGHFWQDRYKSQAIGKDVYFIQCGKYIELNPVRAKIVERPDDHHCSSYRYYARGKPDNLITPGFIYEALGQSPQDRQEKYQKIVVDEIIKQTYNKNIWGSDRQRYREQDKVNRKHQKV